MAGAGVPPPRRSIATEEHRRAARLRTRRRNRVRALAAALVVVAVAAGLGAYQAGKGTNPAAGATPATPPTPVLSLRRIGPVLADRLAVAQIRPVLDQFVTTAPANTCLSVQVGRRDIYEHNPDLPVGPASTQKLVTATALLDELGPKMTLRTSLKAQAKPGPDGTVAGDVWFVGGGDPLLATGPYADHFYDQPQPHTSLEALADALVASGVKRIDGRLLGDESQLDALRVVPSWSPRFTQQHQLGPLSALTVNDNVVNWPPKQLPLSPDGEGVADPPTFAADQLAGLLRQRGVEVAATGAGTAPTGATELAGIDSLPMAGLVGEMLQESDNQTAEILVKVLGSRKGGAGTTAAGVTVLKQAAVRLGLPAQGLGPVDGSGLDDANRQTCRILADALADTPESELVGFLLATAGRTGTLTTRFKGSAVDGRLRAKTGSLNNVSALAGILPTARGAVVSFAFVQNGSDTRPALQEDLARLLDGYPAPGLPTAEQLGPQPTR